MASNTKVTWNKRIARDEKLKQKRSKRIRVQLSKATAKSVAGKK